MSILIKGMKMPKNCMECPFKGFDRAKGNICTIDEEISLHAVLDGLDIKFVKMGNCPLIEIPDHGDLIDKNKAVNLLDHGSKCVSAIQKVAEDEKDISYCQGVMVGYANAIVVLDNAPVVIPAERSEYGN